MEALSSRLYELWYCSGPFGSFKYLIKPVALLFLTRKKDANLRCFGKYKSTFGN